MLVYPLKDLPQRKIQLSWCLSFSDFPDTLERPFSFLPLFFFLKRQHPRLTISISKCVTECKFVCPMQSEAKQMEISEFKGLLQGHARRQVACAQKTPNSLKGFSRAFLKARWGRGVVSCCKLLGVGILCSCSCPCRSGHDVPVNLQQDKCYSPFSNFLSL